MSDAVFNEQAFYSHLGGDVELGGEILRVYLVDAPERAQALAYALASGDKDLAVKYSHALKGISATIRAGSMAMVAERIENFSRKGDLESAKTYMSKVEDELEVVLQAVQDHLNK